MSLRPVGKLPAPTYWRRRIVVALVVLALLVLTLFVILAPSGGSTTDSAGALGSTSSAGVRTSAAASHPTGAAGSAGSTGSGSAGSGPGSAGAGAGAGSAGASQPAAPTATASKGGGSGGCPESALTIAAATETPTFPVGGQPVLYLQVTNVGSTPCSVDLADSQVELRVYNGDARVWGSHDCKVLPGSSLQVLTPQAPVRLSITWTGLTSQPDCTGTRMRATAGVYTLYALLSGRQGTSVQFSLV